MNFTVMKSVAIPHGLKVILFVFVSAGLTAVLANLAKLNLTPSEFLVIQAVINGLLAVVTKYQSTV